MFKVSPPPLPELKVITELQVYCTAQCRHTPASVRVCVCLRFCFRLCQHDTSQQAYTTSINTPRLDRLSKPKNNEKRESVF